ncbi:hypothetical protein BC937DRAFT_92182 [Endogone sp. FLAS-F59071]|nr:hypothetical protein BC937DRAFT_92182 [Endogone sp. FLAS-F59071]|eukprot:RUS15652.1 hypothetical protein BC937DRAFT_92182 [Endogone sp. FLAS-F59071]
MLLPARKKLEDFQKDAIFRQMQEYKRECHRLERRTQQYEEQQVDYESQLSAVNIQWEQRLTGFTENDPTAEAISDALRKKGEYTKEAVVRLLETIEAWLAKRERFFGDLVEKGA